MSVETVCFFSLYIYIYIIFINIYTVYIYIYIYNILCNKINESSPDQILKWIKDSKRCIYIHTMYMLYSPSVYLVICELLNVMLV